MPPTTHLPALLTSFIGRETEIASAARYLARTRLLTLTGTGGVGKTRLALAAAARVAERFPAGVWLVELAALAVPALVAQAIAAALGVREASGRPILDVLIDTLDDQPILLVVDNCEHLLDACAVACEALLLACPRLTVLVTSREPLGIPGETVWRVPSLNVPSHLESARAAQGFEAVRLFVERAAAVHPEFALSDANAAPIGEICRRLDGIPLAIELAAAWVKALSVHEIAARLDDRFRLLTGGGRTALPRQQTLRGTLDWSYELLTERQRVMFRRLAVFEGGWTLDAAECICAVARADLPGSLAGHGDNVVQGQVIHRDDVVELLAHLVDKSLVLADADAATGDEPAVRYHVLETTRHYGLELLEQFDELDLMRQAHAEYFATQARIAQRALLGPRQRQWIGRLDRELDNLRGALRWAAERNASELEVDMVASLWDYWWMRGHLSEGQNAVERALERGPHLPSTARAQAIHGAGLLAAIRGDIPSAKDRMRESAEMYAQLGDAAGSVRPLSDLASSMIFLGDAVSAEALGTHALELARGNSDDWALGYAIHMVGQLRLAQQRYADVIGFADEGIGVWQRLGDARGLAHELLSKAIALRALGQADLAHTTSREALHLFTDLGERWGQFGALLSVAASLAAMGDADAAARLVGAAEAFSQTMGARPIPVWQVELDAARQLSRARLGDRSFEATYAIGCAMPITEAIAVALASVASRQRQELPDGLTPREVEVLQLLAQRYSNREIADALVLSIRTVERHISNIYGKIGITGRREAAMYLRDHHELGASD